MDDIPVEDITREPVQPPTENGTGPSEEEWSRSKAGKEYVPRQGKPGIIYRKGFETIPEARARDASAHEQRPRRRTPTPKKQAPPKEADLKALETLLAETLRTPALAAAMAGDEWAADHFTRNGPYLARNLIVASEHNPWLRHKLEEMAAGEAAMMTAISLVPVMGGLMLYLVPPIVYWFNLPVPDSARQRFGIPDRKEQPPTYAATPESTPPADDEPLPEAA